MKKKINKQPKVNKQPKNTVEKWIPPWKNCKTKRQAYEEAQTATRNVCNRALADKETEINDLKKSGRCQYESTMIEALKSLALCAESAARVALSLNKNL